MARFISEPSTRSVYQRAVVPDARARSAAQRGRVVPDVAILGDPNTGMLIGQTQQFTDGVSFDVFRIGGTSLWSPLLAGFMALADPAVRLRPRVRESGALSPVPLRRVCRCAPGSPRAMARVNYVNGENTLGGSSTTARIVDFPNLTIHTGVGYDTVTGMGSPWGPMFLLLMGAR